MPSFMENLGLADMIDSEDSLMNFIAYLTENGKVIDGYYGHPTFFTSAGSIDFFVKTRKNEDGGLVVCGLDTHCCGQNVWEMRNTGIDITPKDSLPTERTFFFQSNENAGSMIPIYLANADVLPSYLEDDVVNMQMCAFPLTIDYYENEDDYAEHQPADEEGSKWLVAENSLLPLHFLANHAVTEDGVAQESEDCSTDDRVIFRGVVKHLYHGVFKMGENEANTFIRCIIDTDYGELLLAHTVDQVNPEQRKNLKPGAVVYGACVLSGDVAINKYDGGFVKDFDHNIRLFRQAISNGEAERLRPVLTEDAEYFSEASENTFVGPDEIISRLNQVDKVRKQRCTTTMATISSVDSDKLEYPVGTRCILISYEEEGQYEAIAFIDVTENGEIKRIYITEDDRYHFQIDRQPKRSTLLDNLQLPENVLNPICTRAKFHHLIKEDLSLQEIESEIYKRTDYEETAARIIQELQEHPPKDTPKTLECLFGSLFVRSIATVILQKQGHQLTDADAEQLISDALEEKLPTVFDEETESKLIKLMKKGKQFFKDFNFYTTLTEPDEETFMDNLKTAWMAVQYIGHLYAINNF